MKARVCVLVAVSVFSLLHGVAALGSKSLDEYSWTRTLSGGTDIRQKAASVDCGPRIFINSFDYRLSGEGHSTSSTIIDFSTVPVVTVVKIRGACYILDTHADSDFNSVVADLVQRNGSTVADPLVETFWNATDTKLTCENRKELFDSNPAVRKICGRFTPIFEPVRRDASAAPGECEKEISTVSYQTLPHIVLPHHSYKCSSHQHRRG